VPKADIGVVSSLNEKPRRDADAYEFIVQAKATPGMFVPNIGGSAQQHEKDHRHVELEGGS
jgi:hypothetical protein